MSAYEGLGGAEPPWIAHDGSDVCPVPAGHVFDRDYGDGDVFRDSGTACWEQVVRYRDWTAFAQASKQPFIDTAGLERLDADFQRDAQASEPVGEVANPPAFPVAPMLPDIREGSDGMTLRDWFAGQALGGLCANKNAASYARVKDAYELADAMLRARLPAAVAAVEGEN